MTAIVVDASVATDWLLDDEFDPTAASALSRLKEEGAIVPQLWLFEVRNALLTAERRGRISGEETRERLEGLSELPINTDAEPDLDIALGLARTYRLSFYDALYLELAKRRNCALATLDQNLGQAADTEGLLMTDG